MSLAVSGWRGVGLLAEVEFEGVVGMVVRRRRGIEVMRGFCEMFLLLERKREVQKARVARKVGAVVYLVDFV